MTDTASSQDELLNRPSGVLIKTTLVDYPGKVAASYFLKGCNLRCPYCYNVDLVQSEFSSPTSDPVSSNTKSSVTQLFSSPVQVLEHLFKRQNVMNGFVISGGEPLLSPVTPYLIRQAKKIGYSVKLDTNGTLPIILENLINNPETRPDFIALDLKTSPHRYKKDIPVTSPFSQAPIPDLLARTLSLLQSAGSVGFEIRTVLVPGLVEKEEIKQMAALLPKNASWQFAQFRNENCLDPTYTRRSPYTEAQLKELVDYAKTFIPSANLR